MARPERKAGRGPAPGGPKPPAGGGLPVGRILLAIAVTALVGTLGLLMRPEKPDAKVAVEVRATPERTQASGRSGAGTKPGAQAPQPARQAGAGSGQAQRPSGAAKAGAKPSAKPKRPDGKQPGAKKPGAKPPAGKKQAVKKPAVKETGAKKPGAKKPASKKPGKPKKSPIVKGPAAWQGPGFAFRLPAAWMLAPAPMIGKPPHEMRRWELWRPISGGRAKIDIEADRTEDYGRRGALAVARGVAQATAENFGFRGYKAVDLEVKKAPGFYESWTAQVPGSSPFKVVAAHLFRGGTRYRVGAVCPVGPDLPLAEQGLREILKTWSWTGKAPAKPRPAGK